MTQPSDIQLVAHRGDARECPENTLPAFASALALGLRYLELDVQLSADGVPMVIHDDRLERTTAQHGSVFELSAAQLANCRAAEPQRFGARFADTAVPKLDDVLALLRGFGDTQLFVEIKTESLERFGHTRVLGSVLEALRRSSTRCIVISFDAKVIAQARAAAGVPIGWVLSDYDARGQREAQALQPEYLFCDHRALPASGPLWRGTWHWAVYEVDSPALARSLAGRGVRHIETMAARAMSCALR